MMEAEKVGKAIPTPFKKKPAPKHCQICHVIKLPKGGGNKQRHGEGKCQPCPHIFPNLPCQYDEGHKQERQAHKQTDKLKADLAKQQEKDAAALKMANFKVQRVTERLACVATPRCLPFPTIQASPLTDHCCDVMAIRQAQHKLEGSADLQKALLAYVSCCALHCSA
jgi:hypothetical protein